MAASFKSGSWLRPGQQQSGYTPAVGGPCAAAQRKLQEAYLLAKPTSWQMTTFLCLQMYYNMRIKTLQQEARAVIEQAESALKVIVLPSLCHNV